MKENNAQKNVKHIYKPKNSLKFKNQKKKITQTGKKRQKQKKFNENFKLFTVELDQHQLIIQDKKSREA